MKALALATAVAVLLLPLPTAGRARDVARRRVAIAAVRGEPALRTALLTTAGRLPDVRVLDPDLVDAAMKGGGYVGSLNLTLGDARALALVCGADVLILCAGSVVELERERGELVWDSFAGVFIVDGRSGTLVRYQSFRADGRDRVEALARLVDRVERGLQGLDAARPELPAASAPMDDEVVDLVATPDGRPGDTPPRFFKKPHPVYTADAERMHVEASVDVVVEFKADGSYGRIDVVRWAGFGLEDAVIEAVKAAKFYPAHRGGAAAKARALLRYRFSVTSS